MTDSRPDQQRAPFRLVESFDVPELLGAQWWLDETQLLGARNVSNVDVTRRSALATLAALGGAAALGAMALSARGCSRHRSQQVVVPSQRHQQEKSWDVGATEAPLEWIAPTTNDVEGTPFANTRLAWLATDLRPTAAALQPYYVPTLFTSVAQPTRLQKEIRPICTADMAHAAEVGSSVARIFGAAGAPRDVALVVDLIGRESLAFAAGARDEFAPVCVFDNWPHPRGIVPAHLTIGAAVYYRPLLVGRVDDRRRPLFVLDRDRLAEFHQETDRFDNRYLARLPDAAALRKLGIVRVLYVVPRDGGNELDDLNSLFADWKQAGIEVRMLGLDAFAPAGAAPTANTPITDTRPNHYLGSPHGHTWFWLHYPWWSRGPIAPTPPPRRPLGADFSPLVRPSLFRGTGRGIGYTTTMVPDNNARSGTSSGSGWGRSSGGGYFG